MIETNPYYAHESGVGSVFDVATWAPRKAWTLGVAGVVFGSVILLAATYVWDPSLLLEKPPEVLKDLNEEIAKGHRSYPTGMMAGTGAAALFGLVFLVGGIVVLIGAQDSDYYFRAGPGGVSVRVLDGIDWGRLGFGVRIRQFDIGWDDVESWKITQRRQLGSLSRHAGNLGADFKLKTTAGKTHAFSLDLFREPGYIIYDRVREAIETVPASLDRPPGTSDASDGPQPVTADA